MACTERTLRLMIAVNVAALCASAVCGAESNERGTTSAAAKTTKTVDAHLPPNLLPDETLRFETSFPDARVAVHTATGSAWKKDAPTRILIFALPNGNTIEQTFGRAEAEGLDWHYYIQHIGAQTRRIREMHPDRNIATAYLEASAKSWPTWRKTHSPADVMKIIDGIRSGFPADAEAELSGHSGGGAFVTAFINAAPEIPKYVRRISYLDANYSFAAEEGHGAKLLNWLGADDRNMLTVLAYDDRNIKLDGKPVVSATGGTFRATIRMATDFASTIPLTESRVRDFITTIGLNGRLELMAHTNPENKILHTVLVEKNGFIHAHERGRPEAIRSEDFYEDPQTYRKWVR